MSRANRRECVPEITDLAFLGDWAIEFDLAQVSARDWRDFDCFGLVSA